MALRRDYGQPQQGDTGFARTQKHYGRRVNIQAGDLVTTNQVAAFKVPPGFVVTGVNMVATKLDTGGSPAVTINIGDAVVANRFVSASTLGQAGGTTNGQTSQLANTGFLFQTTAETEILISFPAAAATPAAGTLDLYLVGFII